MSDAIFAPLRHWRPAYGARGWFSLGDREVAYGRPDGGIRLRVLRADDGLWTACVGALRCSAVRPGLAMERLLEDGAQGAVAELLAEARAALPEDLR